MTEASYDAERARLRELYGVSKKEAGVRFEQALALLFHRSGWTLEELAKKEKKSKSLIAYQLCFGRFLNFSTIVEKSQSLPKNLTEGRFRELWKRTEGDERLRFRQIIKLLEESSTLAPRRPKIGEAIKQRYADGKWHKLEVITNKIEGDAAHVKETLDGMCKNQTYGVNAEKKKVGTSYEYRIFRAEKSISSIEIEEKITPILLGFEEQGRKNSVTMSPPTVATLAHKLRQLLNEWVKG